MCEIGWGMIDSPRVTIECRPEEYKASFGKKATNLKKDLNELVEVIVVKMCCFALKAVNFYSKPLDSLWLQSDLKHRD